MYKFKIGFKFVKNFFNLNLYFGRNVKSDLILKNKLIFTLNDTGLDTYRFVQKINYTYLSRYKFLLSLYPLLILTRTPFKCDLNDDICVPYNLVGMSTNRTGYVHRSV